MGESWRRAASFSSGKGLFLRRNDGHVVSLGSRGVQHEKRKPSVSRSNRCIDGLTNLRIYEFELRHLRQFVNS